jgi:hypothetical protein
MPTGFDRGGNEKNTNFNNRNFYDGIVVKSPRSPVR